MMNRNLDAFDARIQRIAKDEKAKGRLIAGEGEVRETQVNLSQLKRAALPKLGTGALPYAGGLAEAKDRLIENFPAHLKAGA